MFGDGDKDAQSRPQLSAEMSSWQVFVVDLLIFPVRRNKTQSVSELAVWQAAGRIAGKGGGKRYARTGSASQNDRLPVNFFCGPFTNLSLFRKCMVIPTYRWQLAHITP